MTSKEAIKYLKGDFSEVELKDNESHSDLFAKAFSKAIDALEKSTWHRTAIEKPIIEKEYLCCKEDRFIGKPIFYILDWSNDLYKVDSFDFADKKGKSGFYIYDSEYGHIEWNCDFWKEIDWSDEP